MTYKMKKEMEWSETENNNNVIKYIMTKITYNFPRMECQRISKALHTQIDSLKANF